METAANVCAVCSVPGCLLVACPRVLHSLYCSPFCAGGEGSEPVRVEPGFDPGLAHLPTGRAPRLALGLRSRLQVGRLGGRRREGELDAGSGAGPGSGSCLPWRGAPQAFVSLGPSLAIHSPSPVALMTQPRWQVAGRSHSLGLRCACGLPRGLGRRACPYSCDTGSCVSCVPVCGVCDTVCDCALPPA